MMKKEERLTLKQYQEINGIKRINFNEVEPSEFEEEYASDEMICPYCKKTVPYEAEETDNIIRGTAYQCPYCNEWFYVSAEITVETTCTPMETAVLDHKRHIEGMYDHMDKCAEHGLLFPPTKYGNVEWETYYEFARPLFENQKMEEER